MFNPTGEKATCAELVVVDHFNAPADYERVGVESSGTEYELTFDLPYSSTSVSKGHDYRYQFFVTLSGEQYESCVGTFSVPE